jgi:predicted Zn-dependent peptidase
MRRNRPLSLDEVDRAKRQLEASLAFGWETPEGRMHWMARFALERRPPMDPAESLAQIEQVRREDVLDMAARLSEPDTPFAFAVAGPRRALSTGLMTTFTAIARGDKPVKEVGEVGR